MYVIFFFSICLCVNAPPHVLFDVLRRSQVNVHRILLKNITFSHNILDGMYSVHNEANVSRIASSGTTTF